MLSEDERQKLIDEFENDTWDPVEWDFTEGAEPVIVEVPMYPAEVMAIDRRARQQGKTRNQLIRELATA